MLYLNIATSIGIFPLDVEIDSFDLAKEWLNKNNEISGTIPGTGGKKALFYKPHILVINERPNPNIVPAMPANAPIIFPGPKERN